MEFNSTTPSHSLRDLWLICSRGVSEPRQIGTLFPSGRGVAKAMARAVADRPADGVIELGAGTGPVTQQLLQIVPREWLTCIEIEARFVDHLRETLPGVDVVCAPAEEVSQIWKSRRRPPAGAVVSTLPIRLFPDSTASRILRASFEVMTHGGLFVQQTLRPSSPVPERLVTAHRLSAERCSVVLSNFPPAYVWMYRQSTTNGSG